MIIEKYMIYYYSFNSLIDHNYDVKPFSVEMEVSKEKNAIR